MFVKMFFYVVLIAFCNVVGLACTGKPLSTLMTIAITITYFLNVCGCEEKKTNDNKTNEMEVEK